MLASVAIDTQLAFFETVVSGMVDLFPRLAPKKMIASGVLAFCLFLVGLPLCTQGGMYIYQLLDWYCAVLTYTLLGFLETIVIPYIYGVVDFIF